MTSLDHPSSVRQLTADGTNPNDPSNDGWITPEFGMGSQPSLPGLDREPDPDGYRYQLPPNATEYTQSLQEALQNPYIPTTDLTPGGVGVAPLPAEQRSQIGVFSSR